jgi:nucleoside-diphosphate-sugar epimerase
LLPDDSKAASQFLKNALAGDDIVLKSAGSQLYSYLYVADTVSGMLFALTRGGTDEAYNLADSSCDVSLRDLAQKIAHFVEREVIFDLPDDIERSGYSTATKALLDASKLNALGWRAHYTLDEAIHDTIRIAQSL